MKRIDVYGMIRASMCDMKFKLIWSVSCVDYAPNKSPQKVEYSGGVLKWSEA